MSLMRSWSAQGSWARRSDLSSRSEEFVSSEWTGQAGPATDQRARRAQSCGSTTQPRTAWRPPGSRNTAGSVGMTTLATPIRSAWRDCTEPGWSCSTLPSALASGSFPCSPADSSVLRPRRAPPSTGTFLGVVPNGEAADPPCESQSPLRNAYAQRQGSNSANSGGTKPVAIWVASSDPVSGPRVTPNMP